MRFVGADIGGTQIKAGLVDDQGTVLRNAAADTPANLPRFLRAFERLIREVAGTEPIDGVGIACKGIIAPDTQIQTIPGVYRFLEGQVLADLVRAALRRDLPVQADNDARVALVGELVWGAARRARNAVMLTLGTGVGGAALVEGKLLRGRGGVGGHFGHITADPAGPICNCGNRGCLETYFSGVAIEAEALAAIRRSSESRLTEEFQDQPERLRCADVFRIADAGDSVALQIRDRAIQYLAASVVGLVHAFDPEMVILGGKIAQAGGCIFRTVNRHVRRNTRRLAGGRTPVVPSRLSDSSGIAGAAALARLHLLHPETLR
jgi:glucokinase